MQHSPLWQILGDDLAGFMLVMIAFLFVDIFDTAGTLYGVGRQAGDLDEDGQSRRC